MCGDVYCPSCGNPGAAELEAAEEFVTEELAKHKCTPDEYRFVVSVGLRALESAREMITKSEQERLAIEAEAEAVAMQEPTP